MQEVILYREKISKLNQENIFKIFQNKISSQGYQAKKIDENDEEYNLLIYLKNHKYLRKYVIKIDKVEQYNKMGKINTKMKNYLSTFLSKCFMIHFSELFKKLMLL